MPHRMATARLRTLIDPDRCAAQDFDRVYIRSDTGWRLEQKFSKL